MYVSVARLVGKTVLFLVPNSICSKHLTYWCSDVHKCYINARMNIPKGILLSQKYISTLRQSKASTKNSEKQVFLYNELGSPLILGSTIGCDQQNNNRDFGLFFIANATELAFKGDPGTVSGVSRTAGAFRCYCFAVFVWTREMGLVF